MQLKGCIRSSTFDALPAKLVQRVAREVSFQWNKDRLDGETRILLGAGGRLEALRLCERGLAARWQGWTRATAASLDCGPTRAETADTTACSMKVEDHRSSRGIDEVGRTIDTILPKAEPRNLWHQLLVC